MIKIKKEKSNIDYSDIVSRIQYICEKDGGSLAKLEKEVGLGVGTIRRWVDHNPSFDKVFKVAQQLNITCEQLVFGNKK